MPSGQVVLVSESGRSHRGSENTVDLGRTHRLSPSLE